MRQIIESIEDAGRYAGVKARRVVWHVQDFWPRYALAAVLALVFIFIASAAEAADANVTFTHPTQRTDNSPLPLSEIRETVIEWGQCVSGSFPAAPAGTRTVPAPATATTISGLAYGTWCFRGRTVDTGGLMSDNSSVVNKQFLAPPKPPVLSVQAGAVAYELNITGSGEIKLGRSVGTVSRDSVCGPVYVGDSYAVVPGEAVELDWNRTPKSSIVVAECS